ncbi:MULTISPECIES: TetR/AcrR family transcriptional regulator [Nonomuraea]|uniref:TetR/AcrR family transcriptional regulator n=1 Tax=Nonomuraea mangrovi TaxID=2316207 RepID=A0ABW4SVU9_9ACTN
MSNGRARRAQKAQQTRRRILEAALELFVRDGYGATNLQDVARRAGVAVQTIYFVFGNKRTLLKELVDVTIAGDDEPVATMDRPWYTGALALGTAQDMLRAYVTGTTSVLERVAPIGRVLEAASAGDPEVAALWPHDVDPRYVVQQGAAKALAGKPGARAGLSAEEAVDLLTRPRLRASAPPRLLRLDRAAVLVGGCAGPIGRRFLSAAVLLSAAMRGGGAGAGRSGREGASPCRPR